jgi:DNA-binding beta-propeller fold protein YncE
VSPARLAAALIALALVAAALPVAAEATTPSAYAADSGAPGGVFEFDVGSDGFLAPKPFGPAPAGSSTQDVAVVPSGTSAYAVAGGAGLFPFAIGPNGELSALSGPLAAGSNAVSVATSPDGRSVYVADKGGQVFQYDVGPGGVVAAKSPASVAAGTSTTSVAVSPDGQSVYAVNAGSHDVYRYPVGSGGALGTPEIVPAGTGPSAIALSPDGHSAYVTDTAGNRVLEYDVGATGSLTPKPLPSIGTGAAPTGIAVSPDGKSAYVSNSGDGTVSQYDADAGGELGVKAAAVGLVGGSAPQGLALDSSGTRLFVPDAAGGHNVVYEFPIGSGGAIDRLAPRFVGGGPAPLAVTVRPDQGPAASFTATAGASGTPTAFDGRSSSDSDGTVTHFDWDFGDGSTALDAGPTPTHTYAQAGSYQVTLSVSDDGSCSTRLVFTGRTAYCNGSPAAVVSQTVVVSAAPLPGTPVFFAGVAAKNQTVRVDSHGLARISVRCPRGTFGSCIGTLGLVTAGKVRVPGRHSAKRLLLGQAGFNIVAGKAVKIPVQISKAGRKVLSRRRVLKSNATITAHDRLMTVKKTAFSVRLKPPRRPTRRH